MQDDPNHLGQYAALIDTERMARKIVTAQDVVRRAIILCPDMAISLSGGKDSVAATIIARSVAPKMPILTATPPNPLPYRKDHMADLKSWFGGPWREVGYPWDVGSVLELRMKYPSRLKIKRLLAVCQPGYLLGLRLTESRAREINYRKNGAVYRTTTGWRCLPIATWTAEEVIGLAAFYGAPIAEVYRKPLLGLQLDQIRDGTWWAHKINANIDDWISRNYPSVHHLWEASCRICASGWREEW